jgi:hypothetical protein
LKALKVTRSCVHHPRIVCGSMPIVLQCGKAASECANFS